VTVPFKTSVHCVRVARRLEGACLVVICIFTQASIATPPPTDVAIVGSGIAGLSAALESGRAGHQVLVVDMSTVGGGHAIVSNGAVSLVNTPLQQQKGISDSTEMARKDFLQRGEDADAGWVDLYVKESKSSVYDWLTALGVRFDNLGQPPGNSVPRLHFSHGKGWGLVGPLYRECLRYPNIRFVWATKVERLIVEKNGTVTGFTATNLRTGKRTSFRAKSVIIATGGFGSNLQLVRENWPGWLPQPDRLLAGASQSAVGSGLQMVQGAGGTVSRLDHQWNYVLGLPDPDDPEHMRGLASFDFRSIWVNREGKRFTQEFGDPKINLPDLLGQTDKTYWAVFDSEGVNSFSITLAGWENQEEVDKLVFRTAGVVVKADSLEQLGRNAAISPQGLVETVRRYNRLAAAGDDQDFHTFSPTTSPNPHPIDKPPFYAVQFFPITRKTMGGVTVDLQCRVLSRAGTAIPGLFAVGEVTGFAGINGKAALEGTFLGPGILMGRIAGRWATTSAHGSQNTKLRPLPTPDIPGAFANDACTTCHDLAKEVGRNRPGFWHFEQAHKKVLGRQYRCAECHQAFYPFNPDRHRLNSLALTNSCMTCHGVQAAGRKSGMREAAPPD
jgi:flavocytochrome c